MHSVVVLREMLLNPVEDRNMPVHNNIYNLHIMSFLRKSLLYTGLSGPADLG